MDYRIEQQLTGDIMRVSIYGTANEANAGSIAQDVFRIVDMNDAVRLLVDVRQLKGRLSPGDAYWHVLKYPAYAARTKVGVVDLEENRPYDSFFQAMCKNRGFVLEFFEDVAAAERWLLT